MAVLQAKATILANGTSHSYTFDSGFTLGSTAVLIVEIADTATVGSVATSGDVQSIGTSDATHDNGTVGVRFYAFSRQNCPTGVTGFTFTTSASQSPMVWIFEADDAGDYTAEGANDGEFTDTPTLSITTLADNGEALIAWVCGDTLTADNAGWDHVNTTNQLCQFNDTALGAAGVKTAGFTTSGANFHYGYGVHYQPAGPPPPAPRITHPTRSFMMR